MSFDTIEKHPSHRASAGFTLVEVMVALIIFAITFGALVGLFQTSLRQTGTAEELRQATMFAEAQLERLGHDLPLKPGKLNGGSADGTLRWQADISLARPIEEGDDIALYQIRLDAGRVGGVPSLVSLTTLRLGNR